VQHDFATSLAKSHAQEGAEWWPRVYREAFPNLVTLASVRQDGWAQRGGIDRVLTLGSGKTLTVDEKVRYKDYNDVALEYWSVWRNGKGVTPGWVAKDLACDYIAYAWVPTERCLLLPFQELRRAWKKHAREWVDLGQRASAGFYVARAENDGYQTHSVCVPERVLLDAIRDCLTVRWGSVSSESQKHQAVAV